MRTRSIVAGLLSSALIATAGCSSSSAPSIDVSSPGTTSSGLEPGHSETSAPPPFASPTRTSQDTSAPSRATATPDEPGEVPTQAAIPEQVVGTWQSLDQGDAEDVIELHRDGTYVRGQVLMQARSSGTFQFSIATAGSIELTRSTMTLLPERGLETLQDPDSPSSSYQDRPLTDLKPESFEWTFDGDRLVLVTEYGPVAFQRIDSTG